MEPGRIAVIVGLAASLLSFVFYLVALRKSAPSGGGSSEGRSRARSLARSTYALSAGAGVFCFAWLMHLVASKRFEYRYVFDYTSADLDGVFLYSATWAGQEGSFALWAALTAIIGLYIVWKGRDWETRVMPVYLTNMIALFAIMHWLSPYVVMPAETGPRPADVPPGMPWPPPWPPQDGNGLNPSLQNIWMALHPPTIFVGFASLAVPFSYAIAGLLSRSYDAWARRVAPFVMFTVATLGLGLFMGGYWAYETQGWHGFWAWDPVENASLFPWLGSLALAHGLVVQRARGGMARTNLFLAVASWLLFVYGTFLTRSGVLANFSVHAFGMLDNAALKILVVLIAVQGLGAVGLLIRRWRDIRSREISDATLSLDAALWFAVLLMCIATAVICLGTSWPLISRWHIWRSIPGLAGLYAADGVRVEPIFYNRVGTALTIPTLLILGVTPFLVWGRTEGEQVLRRVMLPWLLAIAGGGAVLWFVLHEAASGFEASTPRVVTVAVGTLGIFAALTNGALAMKLLRAKRSYLGAWLSHAGVGLLLLGTVLTNVYEKTASYAVIEGRGPVRTAFGYSIEFAGWTHEGKAEEEVLSDWRRFDHAVRLRVRPDGARGFKPYEARVAVFKYWNAGQGEWSTMTWPDIRKQWHRDVYLAAADDPKLVRPIATLRPGETSTIGVPGLGPTGYEVRYDRFYRSDHSEQMAGEMGAEMTLRTPDGKEVNIRPGLVFDGAESKSVHIAIPELNGAVILQDGINPDTKQVTAAFELPGAPASWVVPIAATNKPMINLVWAGVVFIGLGALVAMARRAREVEAPTTAA